MGQRVITGVLVGILALALIFLFPPWAAFLGIVFVFVAATSEFVAIARFWAPAAPLRSLLFWVPTAALLGMWQLDHDPLPARLGTFLPLALGFSLVLVAALTTLLGRCPIQEGAASMGLIAFAIPYFSLPPLALYALQKVDSWLLFLLVAIVAFGDSAAYFVGRVIGRHKLAPVVSPKKSWEGSIAGMVAALVTAAIWSWAYLDRLAPELMALAAVTQVVAQFGDLVESLIKRGAGVKDSSNVLPGHGGLFDRLDALILAAPFFAVGVWSLGVDRFVP